MKPDYYIVLRNSCFWALLPEIRFCSSHAVISECCAVFYSYFIGNMISYVKDEDATMKDGIQLATTFFFAQLVA